MKTVWAVTAAGGCWHRAETRQLHTDPSPPPAHDMVCSTGAPERLRQHDTGEPRGQEARRPWGWPGRLLRPPWLSVPL